MFNGRHNCLNFKKCYLPMKRFLFRVVRTCTDMHGLICVAPKTFVIHRTIFFWINYSWKSGTPDNLIYKIKNKCRLRAKG